MSADLFGNSHPIRKAMGSHQAASGGADEWLTPPDLISAIGPFDLDPCAPVNRPWDTASAHYTILEDGLRQSWRGRVWLNPPYSQAARWLARLAEHGEGTALIFARTETRMWFEQVWPRASAVLFIKGRLHFHYASGKRAAANSGAPSALVSYGGRDAQRLASGAWPGQYLPLNIRRSA